MVCSSVGEMERVSSLRCFIDVVRGSMRGVD